MIPAGKKVTARKQATNIFALLFALMAILGLISIISPDVAEVAQTSTESIQPRSNYSGYLLRIVVVTITMIAVLIVSLKIYKKQMKLKGGNNLRVTTLGKHYINDKQYLLKVNIEDKNILLGVSDSSINYLTELEYSADEKADEDRSFGTILDLETNEETKV